MFGKERVITKNATYDVWSNLFSDQVQLEAFGFRPAHKALRRTVITGSLTRLQASEILHLTRPAMLCPIDKEPGLYLREQLSGYIRTSTSFDCSNGHEFTIQYQEQ